jgi:coniferyl-aldehyde dehydrogenase
MSLAAATIVDRSPGSHSDAVPIAQLQARLELQKAAFRRDPYPSAERRVEHLQALAGMLVGAREQIRSALREDFGSHPDTFTDLLEVLGPAGRAVAAIESLGAWMADEVRPADPALFGSAQVTMRYEPKGVVGNMAPWNFPFDVGCGPVAEMLAAGNRVIIKPSDLTPACGELLAELVASAFDADHVTVAVGGVALAEAFSALPWDHLLYTGSPGVGRKVMRAAAEHLVPVTLELGGKCPAVLTPSGVTPAAVESIIGTKLVKNGQMCITVDHVFVPRSELPRFVELCQEYVGERLAGHAASDDCCGIITPHHLERIEALLDDARARGAEVLPLEATPTDPARRRMPLSLVIDPDPGSRVCQEEVFGPILPVLPYDDLDTAVARIDERDRPLGLYVFGADLAECEHVLRTVRSGGACINGCALQGAVPSLGFGGSGTSGMGAHHGIEGFREFSNARGVVVCTGDENTDVLFPPYAEKARAVAAAAFGE